MSKDRKTDILTTIDTPTDLRKLSVNELPQVCQELREFIIDACSTNPGHFGSNMGAVELTVALHYVFNTPYDRIVWDVGHQAYGHKILTGRRKRFGTNRKLNGLSGFPNPAESEYDAFIGGHASNSISAALGMAIATELLLPLLAMPPLREVWHLKDLTTLRPTPTTYSLSSTITIWPSTTT